MALLSEKVDGDMDLNALREFSAIASEGSFAGAARKLGTPKSTVSKRIQDLEADLGVQLIERSTRKLRLTAEGSLVLARAERILADSREITQSLLKGSEDVQGHLRIAAPVLFGQAYLGQIAAVCRRLYPDLTLEIVLTDSQPDLIEEGFDAAIRFGEMPNGQFVSRPLATGHSVAVAAPGLVPHRLSDPLGLASFPVLIFGIGLVQAWHFTNGKSKTSVRLAGGLAMTNHVALREAALGGAGIALLPLFLIEDDIKAGRLVPVLDGWSSEPNELSIVYPSAQSLTARLRSFIDVVTNAFPDETLHNSVLSGQV